MFLSNDYVEPNFYPLLGIACTLIGSKFEEIYPPSINDLTVAYNNYKLPEIYKAE